MRHLTLAAVAVLLATSTADAQQPAASVQYDWLLQTQGDGTALAHSFLTTKASDIALTPTIAATWTCKASDVSTSKEIVQRTITCYSKDNASQRITGAVGVKASCRHDGQNTGASAVFLTVAGAKEKADGTPEVHSMELSLMCAKKP